MIDEYFVYIDTIRKDYQVRSMRCAPTTNDPASACLAIIDDIMYSTAGQKYMEAFQ
jgi:hypothetical protein